MGRTEVFDFLPPRLNLLGNSSMGMHPVASAPFHFGQPPAQPVIRLFRSCNHHCGKWLPPMPRKFGGNKLDFVADLSPLALNYNASSMAGSSCSEFQATSQEDPGPYYGSYATELALGKYTLSWDSLRSMEH